MSFLLVPCHARCGSSVICSSLHAHPKCKCVDEPFKKVPFSDTSAHKEAFGSFGDKHPYAALTNRMEYIRYFLLSDPERWDVKATGAKVFWNWIGRCEWEELRDKSDMKFIVLYRENLLEAYVSGEQAMASQFHFARMKNPLYSTEPMTVPMVNIDIADMLDRIGKYRTHCLDAVEVLNKRVKVIRYADVCNRYNVLMERLQVFLGLPVFRLPCLLVKTGSKNLAKRVLNFDETKTAYDEWLEQTGWLTEIDGGCSSVG